MAAAGNTYQKLRPISPVSAASVTTTMALSAIGSSIFPIAETCFQRRATQPSRKSVSAAATKRTKAIHPESGLSKSANTNAMSGAASTRNTVNELGTFQIKSRLRRAGKENAALFFAGPPLNCKPVNCGASGLMGGRQSQGPESQV